MALPDVDTVLGWRGRTITDETGEKIGKFEEIYLDTQTDRPEWAAVRSGLFGRRQLLVPLSEAEERDDGTLQVPFAKSHVESAPDVDADGELSQDEEARLYGHYGLDYSKEESETGLPRGAERQGDTSTGSARPSDARTPAGGADAASGTDDAVEVTRSEEEVKTGVEQRPRERVRLKKYVVTDEVTKKVPVRREEIRVEREPADDESE